MDDDLLREALEMRSASAPGGLTERARLIALAEPRARRWRGPRTGTGWLAAVSGVGSIGAVVAIAFALALRPTPGTPAVSPNGSPQVLASMEPLARPSGPTPTPWSNLTWTVGDVEPFNWPGNTYVTAAAPMREGWIAVGYTIEDDAVTGRVWTSTDGLSWQVDPGNWAGTHLDGVAVRPDRIVITGYHRELGRGDERDHRTLAMWSSTGIGQPWSEIVLPDAFPTGYAIWQTRAVGERDWLVRVTELTGVETWLLGTPGGEWREAPPEPGLFAGASVGSIVARPGGGWVAVGMTGIDAPREDNDGLLDMGDPDNDRAAAWFSDDGQHWTPGTVEGEGTSIGQVVPIAGGWIAIGTDHGGCPRCIGHPTLVWRSTDGRTWAPVPVDGGGPNHIGGLLVGSDGGRAVAIDVSEGRVRVRETVDGSDWHELQVFVGPNLGPETILTFGLPVIGPRGILAFDHTHVPDRGERMWAVPYVGMPGDAPSGAATQAPIPQGSDTPCGSAGQECGP